jgi:hypothetical protein
MVFHPPQLHRSPQLFQGVYARSGDARLSSFAGNVFRFFSSYFHYFLPRRPPGFTSS